MFCRAKVILNVVRRLAESLVSVNVALWERRMSATSMSPRPRSGRLVEKNGVKSRRALASLIPAPLSMISMPCVSVRIVIRPEGLEAMFSAEFLTMLTITRSMSMTSILAKRRKSGAGSMRSSMLSGKAAARLGLRLSSHSPTFVSTGSGAGSLTMSA